MGKYPVSRCLTTCKSAAGHHPRARTNLRSTARSRRAAPERDSAPGPACRLHLRVRPHPYCSDLHRSAARGASRGSTASCSPRGRLRQPGRRLCRSSQCRAGEKGGEALRRRPAHRHPQAGVHFHRGRGSARSRRARAGPGPLSQPSAPMLQSGAAPGLMRPNDVQISCRPSGPPPHKSTLPLFGHAERGPWGGAPARPGLSAAFAG